MSTHTMTAVPTTGYAVHTPTEQHAGWSLSLSTAYAIADALGGGRIEPLGKVTGDPCSTPDDAFEAAWGGPNVHESLHDGVLVIEVR